MSDTTNTVRTQGFLPLACDIPTGMTIAEYRAMRPAAPANVNRPPQRRRRGRRRADAAS